MKKNFFKKLSFVLALAMIITAIAPAAGAFAATDLHLNSTKKYLHLSPATGYSEFDFNISHATRGSKAVWSTSDEDVAVVDETTGFTTATGVGTATISVDVTAKDGTVTPLEATVVVRDNIDTVKVSNAPDKALAVNQAYDFNRSFVTVSGSTKVTSSITRWTVDKTTATIDKSGVFKATAAGEYKVTALAFQSTAKYDEWLVSKATSLVLDSNEVTVTVDAGIVATKQITLSKFTVEFDSDMSKTDLSRDTAKVYQVINGKQVATGTEKIKTLALDATGKIATVEMYTNFNEAGLYDFVYGKLTSSFTAAETGLSKIASIEFADFTHDVTSATATGMLAKVIAKDANGVVILAGDTSALFASCLSFSYDGDVTKGYLDSTTSSIYLYTEGYQAPLTVTYTNYLYNETTKTYDLITLKDSAIVTAVKADTNLNTASIQYAVAKTVPASDSTAWSSAISLAAGDTGYRVFTRSKNNNAASDAPYTVDVASRFSYTSSNTDKLIVSGDYIYPIASGVVTVIVKDTTNDNKVVGTFDVTIMAARAFASATLDTAYVTVSNNATYGADGTVALASVTAKDSMGAATFVALTPDTVTGPGGNDAPVLVVDNNNAGDNFGKALIGVDATAADPGAYSYKIKVTACGTDKFVFMTVVVIDGTDLTVTSYRLELSASSFDLKEVKAAKTIDIAVAGYNKNGVKVSELPVSGYAVTVTKDGSGVAATDTALNVVTGVSGSALTPLATGTYVVTAKVEGAALLGKAVGSVIGVTTFTLSDTTTKAVIVSNPVVTSDDVLAMVQSAFTFKLNGTDVTDAQEANITGVTYNTGAAQSTNMATVIAVGSSIYVTSVTYKVDNADGTDTVYTFAPNATIKAK